MNTIDLTVSVYGEEAVVDDGQYLWTADKVALFEGLGRVIPEYDPLPSRHLFAGDADRTYDISLDSASYRELCDIVKNLAQANTARHKRVVSAWRETHDAEGNWS